MDTGNGKFESVEASSPDELETKKKALEARFPNHGGWFKEGETIVIKGSIFRIKRVKPTEIVLKLERRALQIREAIK